MISAIRFTRLSRIAKCLRKVSKEQSSPRWPNPSWQNMSNGMALGFALTSLPKTKRAFGSIKRRINQADDTRSIPGRGRVIQIRSLYSPDFAFDLDFVVSDSSARANMASNLALKG